MRYFMVMAMVVISLFTGGCSLHKRTAEDRITTQTSDLATGDSVTQNQDEAIWWRVFGDDGLNRLMAKAFSEDGSRLLASARAGVEKAEAFLASQRATDLPGVNVSGGLSRSRSQSPMGGVSSNWDLSLASSYELDLWGRRAALKNQRELDREMAVLSLRSATISLSARVADTWYLLLERTRQWELAKEEADLRKERLETVTHRYQQGVVPVSSVYGARSQLAMTKARVAALKGDVDVAAHALSSLLNSKPGVPLSSAGVPLPRLPELSQTPLNSELVLNRPDVQLAMASVRKADEKVAVSFADRFPSFSLTAGYGRAGYDSGGMSGSGPAWNIGGNLLAPILDWGGRKARVSAGEASLSQAEADLRTAALEAFQETADALTRCRQAEISLGEYEEALRSSHSNTAFENAKYLEGASDYLDLLDAKMAEVTARSQLVLAERQVITGRISLARALGSKSK